ncbi:MAG: chemotaxis protein CheC [Candidatus Omnitrophica bacterium]|nr:chemotaxis protein CheC [Candidatus Omnitrophota bacterium]
MRDEMDVLKEVATIAAAHGSNALSEILKRTIKLNLPLVTTVTPDNLEKEIDSDEIVLSVQSRILSGIEGKVLLVLEEKSAFRLINICYKGEDKVSSGFLTEVGLSVVKEIGNVVIGSYVGALSMFLKLLIVPSIPTLISGPLYEIVSSALSLEKEHILMIEAVFEESEEKIKGKMYFVLTQRGREIINQACDKILESLEK